MAATDYQVDGKNPAALFSLRLHRGDGMLLLGMNWKDSPPPVDFVGFAIDYKEPGGSRFFALKNRLAFEPVTGKISGAKLSTRLSPIQKFRWVHFPRNAEIEGEFVYRVTPVFMNAAQELSYGEPQEGAIELRRETHPDLLNVAFTRGFVSSQAFVERYESAGPISTLLPETADEGLTFVPSHPKTAEALEWMGFEARAVLLDLLEKGIADASAQVRVVGYDLNEPELLSRFKRLGPRLKIIVDDSDSHGRAGSAETSASTALRATAGDDNVRRQHVRKLQHNKFVAVSGDAVSAVICGSTNFSWRGLYVQSNNALCIRGSAATKTFFDAFDRYWPDDPGEFGRSASADWTRLLTKVNARVSFSPHASDNRRLASIAADISQNTSSSLLFSLAFLYQTPGPILDAIKKVAADPGRFVYGISDHEVDGLQLTKPDASVVTVSSAALRAKVPPPFSKEPTGGGGVRMHHKFAVIDFDEPSARVYTGSYNFSGAADNDNGEQLLLIRDRRVAVSYAVEALRIFDHYHFRVAQQEARRAGKKLVLARPPTQPGVEPWWREHYTDIRKVRDRELFGG